jgi:succinate dehydrogenase / fumarate reductase cytochrome b subunit
MAGVMNPRARTRFSEKEAMSSADVKANRPLSPHIQIYRWRLTMAMSIAHRITGGGLYVGTLLLVWWLAAAASGPEAFAVANAAASSWLGLLILAGYSWALIHHMFGGLRHFVWDFGAGLGKPARDRIAVATIAGSLSATAAILAIGLWLRG